MTAGLDTGVTVVAVVGASLEYQNLRKGEYQNLRKDDCRVLTVGILTGEQISFLFWP